MKISPEQVQQLLQAQRVKGTGNVHKTRPVDAAPSTDGASLSAESQEISKALSVIGKTPEARADKVAALKAQVQAGTYAVSGQDVAESVLKRNLADDLA